VDGPVNWNSPKQVTEALATVGHKVQSTARATLSRLRSPLASALLEYRDAVKLAGTYGRKFVGDHVADDDRIYAGWNQLGSITGRMSCKGPNLQNIPRNKRYRSCFVPSHGHVFIKGDFSQIELRVVAKISGDARMIEAFKNGQDLHETTARQITGKDTVSKDERQLAKVLNFGLLYGMGAERLQAYARDQYGVELSEADAERYRDKFFDTYSGLYKWHRKAAMSMKRYQFVSTRTLIGRRCRGVDRYTDRLAFPVQGTAADALKMTLALLYKRRDQCPTAVPVLCVHDEFVLEVPTADVDATLAWFKQAVYDGLAPLLLPVPVDVEISVLKSWGSE
jgi:DNA polymerase-1